MWLVVAVVVSVLFVAQMTPSASAEVVAWFDDPWRFTDGGTMLPTPEDLARPWYMRACRNDIEQAFIGLVNRGEDWVDVTVSLEHNLHEDTAKSQLLIAGAIRSRKNPDGALVNLFMPQQLASFEGKFPPTFTNIAQIKDFPTLHLQPNHPAWSVS